MNSAQVVRALQEVHPPPQWASWAELANGTGGKKTRSIDLFALDLYPSSNFRSFAYEVKVSRSDFRRELDDPSKRSPWEALCSETWFAAPVGVIPPSEVPEGWGLRELQEDGVWRRTIRARQREVLPVWPLSFVASIARRSSDAPPAPLEAWEVLGRKVTVDHVVKIAEALLRHRREWLAPPPPVEDPKRKAQLAEVFSLRWEVQRLCGRGIYTAEDFREWFQKNALVDMDPNRTRILRQARDMLIEILGGEPS
jgi:hypothetical protein